MSFGGCHTLDVQQRRYRRWFCNFGLMWITSWKTLNKSLKIKKTFHSLRPTCGSDGVIEIKWKKHELLLHPHFIFEAFTSLFVPIHFFAGKNFDIELIMSNVFIAIESPGFVFPTMQLNQGTWPKKPAVWWSCCHISYRSLQTFFFFKWYCSRN